ncbi:carboxylesterase/lipase family protein [Gordonia neofelifaecis]|uniref:Carboxylic ester hydrolase n=1 Tax=Gordonia neofelifaecis NRRL B-59395 TaxID=644548 RepID=F1YKT5_9ACTN|nr:carboxylesterase family protein [Gordonia neofelifaecis]EGD54729.1 carboxylesterase [Gordonia neofelifaecis NRRL B-59395]
MTRISTDSPVVSTTGGRVRGTSDGAVSAFLGIPYAAPPVGPLAFAAPAPHEPWDDVLDATSYGPTAPQVGYPAPIAALLDNVIELGDDYLNLNVWTPDPDAADLPVMVWIHGGAFSRGSNRIEIYAGDTFARDGVVCVGVNYRLGVPGFGALPDAPDNRGLLDQIAALEWVRDNISAFGGDPGNVTIFGESAGAMSVASLLSSPRAVGLFRHAAMESGNGITAADVDDARKVTAKLAEKLGVDHTAAALGRVPMPDLLKAQTEVVLEFTMNPDPEIWGKTVADIGLGIMSTFPVLDGDVLPDIPQNRIADGAGADVPLLAGWNATEFRFFFAPTGVVAGATPEAARGMLGRAGMPTDLLDQRLADGVSAGDALCEAVTAIAFADPTRALAELRPDSPTYLYEFGWESPVADIRAGHAVELPFVFDHLDAAHSLTGPEPDQSVADEMHSAWVRFAKTGDPGWAAHRAGAEPRPFG